MRASATVSQPLTISTTPTTPVTTAAQACAQRRPVGESRLTNTSTPMCSPRRNVCAAPSNTVTTRANPTTSSTQTGAALNT
ncbi:MAG: hypothetical protein R3E56_18165 [Burkholderiaceae bacterium]